MTAEKEIIITRGDVVELKMQAKHLQADIDKHDAEIAALQKGRAAVAKQLRSVTTKLVTLEIKGVK
jgi:cell division protein FtsB